MQGHVQSWTKIEALQMCDPHPFLLLLDVEQTILFYDLVALG